jgi:hypothetical protein
VVDDTPGVQLAAILTLNPYGPVIDGHRVRGYMSAHANAILEIDDRRSLKSRREIDASSRSYDRPRWESFFT